MRGSRDFEEEEILRRSGSYLIGSNILRLTISIRNEVNFVWLLGAE